MFWRFFFELDLSSLKFCLNNCSISHVCLVYPWAACKLTSYLAVFIHIRDGDIRSNVNSRGIEDALFDLDGFQEPLISTRLGFEYLMKHALPCLIL